MNPSRRFRFDTFTSNGSFFAAIHSTVKFGRKQTFNLGLLVIRPISLPFSFSPKPKVRPVPSSSPNQQGTSSPPSRVIIQQGRLSENLNDVPSSLSPISTVANQNYGNRCL
ncbi:MAG TPA: hypothetical protein VGO47_12830 [Chlamydiales bacterium]|nr:hypothetical protein [Chlamydiales bacterium]